MLRMPDLTKRDIREEREGEGTAGQTSNNPVKHLPFDKTIYSTLFLLNSTSGTTL